MYSIVPSEKPAHEFRLSSINRMPELGSLQYVVCRSRSSTGAQGFERTVVFALDDEPAEIAERVGETLEE